MADEQQYRIAGGLLKALEQCVGRIEIHRLGGLQQYHLAPTQLRSLGDEADQITHLVDPYGLVDLFRLEDVMVGVRMCSQQLTSLAFTTGRGVYGPLAKQQRHQLLG